MTEWRRNPKIEKTWPSFSAILRRKTTRNHEKSNKNQKKNGLEIQKLKKFGHENFSIFGSFFCVFFDF